MKFRLIFLVLLMILSSSSLFSQICGGFQFDNKGHINFVGYNTLGYDYTINVRLESISSDNSIRKNIQANQGVKIGPGSNFGNWYWKKGDLVIITYPNNQCAMWECPETDKYYDGPFRIFTPTQDYVFVTTSDGGGLGYYQVLSEKDKPYIFFKDEYIEVPKNKKSFRVRKYTYLYQYI